MNEQNNLSKVTVISTGHTIKAARGLWHSAKDAISGPLADAWITIRLGDYDFGLYPGESDIYDLSILTDQHQKLIKNAYVYALNHPQLPSYTYEPTD
jgi:hypothetical protein